MKIERNKTALLVIHFQNDFCQTHSDESIQGAKRIAKKINQLIKFCEKNAVQILLSKATYDSKYLSDFQKLHWMKEEDYPCREGTKGHEYYKLKIPKSAVEFKSSRNDSFVGTPLETLLKAKGIDTLLIVGATTEVCVHTTTCSADARDFRAIVIQDCVGSPNPLRHEVSLSILRDHFADVIPSKMLMRLIQ